MQRDDLPARNQPGSVSDLLGTRWPSRFLAVPSGRLDQDGSVEASEKASPSQMRAYVSNIPATYQHLRNGAMPAQFEAMRRSSDIQQQAVGETYHRFFSPAGDNYRIEADLEDGERLVVTRGRHRVEAAKQLGLPYLPVHVRAPNDRALDAVASDFESAVATSEPHVVEVQRYLDAEHRATKSDPNRRTNLPTRTETGRSDPRLRNPTEPGTTRADVKPNREMTR